MREEFFIGPGGFVVFVVAGELVGDIQEVLARDDLFIIEGNEF